MVIDLGQTISPEDRVRYYNDMMKDPCAYCGQRRTQVSWRDKRNRNSRWRNRLRMTHDHIVPCGKRRKFPTRQYSNLTAACHRCNGAKANISLLHFLLDAGITDIQ